MGLKTEQRPAVTAADFDYPEHDPQWIPAGSARICAVCGRLDLPEARPGAELGVRLPTGVVLRGGPDLGGDEMFYVEEKWS
jgi:hypothetical protein